MAETLFTALGWCRSRFDDGSGAVSVIASPGEGVQGAHVLRDVGVEDESAARETVEENVEPAVAGDHGAADAEEGEVDMGTGHGCYARGG